MRMPTRLPDKLAVENIVYSIDFSGRLDTGDHISAAAIIPEVGTVVATIVSFTNTGVVVRISGGTAVELTRFEVETTTIGGETPSEMVEVAVVG